MQGTLISGGTESIRRVCYLFIYFFTNKTPHAAIFLVLYNQIHLESVSLVVDSCERPYLHSYTSMM